MIDEPITIQSEKLLRNGKTEIYSGNNLARINPMRRVHCAGSVAFVMVMGIILGIIFITILLGLYKVMWVI